MASRERRNARDRRHNADIGVTGIGVSEGWELSFAERVGGQPNVGSNEQIFNP